MSTLTTAITIDAQGAGLMLLRARGLAEMVPDLVEGGVMFAVQEHVRTHYQGKPNKLGAPGTGYWEKVIQSAQSVVSGEAVTVTLRGIGLAMKYHGGTILPGKGISKKTGKPTRMLAIPVAAEAYGKTPGMFGNLEREGNGLFAPVAGKGFGAQLFRLARKARIKPDANILPPAGVVVAACETAFADAVRGLDAAAV